LNKEVLIQDDEMVVFICDSNNINPRSKDKEKYEKSLFKSELRLRECLDNESSKHAARRYDGSQESANSSRGMKIEPCSLVSSYS
jgi:hypothetical protein